MEKEAFDFPKRWIDFKIWANTFLSFMALLIVYILRKVISHIWSIYNRHASECSDMWHAFLEKTGG